MFFVVKSSPGNTRYDLARKKSWARGLLVIYPHRAEEKALNEYLKTNYKVTLIQACFYIINCINYSINQNNELIGRFYDKKAEILAELITYGNLEVKGSAILKHCLGFD